MISLIVAASSNNAIGKNNQLPWHLPNDLKYFKNITWGSVVIMGRKTFESVNKHLPGRINIVVTRNREWNAENVIVAESINEAIQKAQATNCKDIFIIGGAIIYKESFEKADRIYLTRVHTEIIGDAHFPKIDPAEWQLESSKNFDADDKHAYEYSFEIWNRKTN